MSVKELSKYTFVAKYAKYLPEKKRRETWVETVTRVKEMHLGRYPQIADEIEWAFDRVYDKLVLPAMRTLQYGGAPILKNHCRNYNCAATYCDRVRFFQEMLFILLSGTGAGFSVQKHHISKLPNIKPRTKGTKTFVIPDSIEGWSDAVGVLISSFIDEEFATFPEYSGYEIVFDASLIRAKGEKVSSGGKAPGPQPLMNALSHSKNVIEERLKTSDRLRPIDAYDIVAHCSDCVVSGGHRRSALLVMFSHDDEDMLTAKIGDWRYKNEQRGRSNNSATIVRNKITQVEFDKIIENTKEFGEPGFIFVDNTEQLYNPCQPSWAKVLAPEGIRTFADIKEGSTIWSEEGWTKVVKKWSTGTNKVYKYRTTAGVFYGTEGHRVLQGGKKVEAKEATGIDALVGPLAENDTKIDPQDVMDGLVIGDGTTHVASNNGVFLCIGEKDQDYFDSEVNDLITKYRPGVGKHCYSVKTTITGDELPQTFNRKVPDRFLYGNSRAVRGFLRGLYSANGSVCGTRITLKAASLNIIEDVQAMLSSIGIKSYYTTNKPTVVSFFNGEYLCKQSYDLNITSSRELFVQLVGFIHKDKQDRALETIAVQKRTKKNKVEFKILGVDLVSEEETFDITVDNSSHTYWTQGCNVSNCVEAGLYGYDDKGNSGWQMCNLTISNGKKIGSKEVFREASRASAIIGTCQAGYTNFPYLGSVTEYIVSKEALLGCSVTGVMENPDIILDPDIQNEVAEYILSVNEEIAKKIGINPCARATLQKPDGTSSCVLGTSSGIHPHHAKRYFRRVQANKTENVFNHFAKVNPQACEESVWSANKTDAYITFCIEVNPKSRLKNDMGAIDLLEQVKLMQQNWVESGTRKTHCVEPWLRHSVSNTVSVRPEEWDAVSKYLYENRQHFAGVSLLSATGDKDYPQAPFCTVYTAQAILKHYGDGALLCSGLIEKCVRLFDGNLWLACDFINGVIEDEREECRELLTKATNFSFRYFGGDIKKMTYALKDVYNLKLWNDLNRDYQEVDYTKMIEDTDNTTFSQESACAGGKCEII